MSKNLFACTVLYTGQIRTLPLTIVQVCDVCEKDFLRLALVKLTLKVIRECLVLLCGLYKLTVRIGLAYLTTNPYLRMIRRIFLWFMMTPLLCSKHIFKTSAPTFPLRFSKCSLMSNRSCSSASSLSCRACSAANHR